MFKEYTIINIYNVIVLYYIKRYFDKREIVQKVYEFFPSTEQVVTSPTIKQNHWRIAVTTDDRFYVGTVENGHIQLMDEFERVPLPDTEIINIAKTDRKSTRLNSSHVAISYAVFCLKKKIIKK